MARAAFVLGIWILAAALGVVGYQVLTLYFYEQWPSVSLDTGWQDVLGTWQMLWNISARDTPDALGWFGRVPLVLAGIVLSYLLFLLSDSLRGRSARPRG